MAELTEAGLRRLWRALQELRDEEDFEIMSDEEVAAIEAEYQAHGCPQMLPDVAARMDAWWRDFLDQNLPERKGGTDIPVGTSVPPSPAG